MITEGRVRALEDELKVVKNEIQATLLDIQKEILTHYYSSEQARDNPAAVRERPRFREDAGDRSSPETPSRESRTTNGPAPVEEPLPRSAASEARIEQRRLGARSGREMLRDPATWSTVAKLLIWVNESVAEIGKDRTIRAIKMYGLHDYISPEMQKTLLALTAFCHEERPPSQVNLRRLLENLAKFHGILEERNQRVDLYHILSLIGEILP